MTGSRPCRPLCTNMAYSACFCERMQHRSSYQRKASCTMEACPYFGPVHGRMHQRRWRVPGHVGRCGGHSAGAPGEVVIQGSSNRSTDRFVLLQCSFRLKYEPFVVFLHMRALFVLRAGAQVNSVHWRIVPLGPCASRLGTSCAAFLRLHPVPNLEFLWELILLAACVGKRASSTNVLFTVAFSILRWH